MDKIYKGMIRLFAIVAFMCSGLKVSATHASGNEITYKWIDTLTYEVTFLYYRDCKGVALNNPSNTCNVVCLTSGSSVRLSLTLVSIKELQTVCDTIGFTCNGTNKNGSGTGFEVHTYKDTVDFRTSKFSGLLKSGCLELYFVGGECCRNSNITTGPAGQNLYNYAYLSLKKGLRNSSPEFVLPPIPYVICNQPMCYSVGAIDTIDGDSLSYHIVPPASGWGKTISVNYPPFTVYYPGSLKFPYNKPNANPPIGFYFNEETGRVVFTPIKCSETTTMVFEVREWRKDKSGRYIKIGFIRRDMLYIVKQAKLNNPPTLKASYNYSICEGDSFCANFKTQDKVIVPPPPAPTPDPDSTKIRWNRGIPGGHFTIVSDTALNQTGRFCWKPKVGTARTLPYQFDVEIIDNNCPNRGISYYPIQVSVKHKASTTITIDSLGCGQYVLQSHIDTNTAYFPIQYSWVLRDENGQVESNRKGPIFSSTESFASKKASDTVQFQHGGKYVMEHTINNRHKCPQTYFDTIVVPELLEVTMASQVDTFVCQGNSKDLKATISNGSTPATYYWSTGDTSDYTTISMPDSVLLDTISIVVTDTTGCFATDEIEMINRPRPVIDQISDLEICLGDSVKIKPTGNLAWWDDPRDKDTTEFRQGSDLYFTLVENGKAGNRDTSFWIKNNTDYSVLGADSLGCADTTNFRLSHPKLNMPNDLEVCFDAGRINLILIEDAQNSGGKWSCPSDTGIVVRGYEVLIDSFNAIHNSVTKIIYYRFVHKTLGCVLIDSFKITVNPLPKVNLSDGNFCQDQEIINLRNDGIINHPGGGNLNLGRQAWKCIDCRSYKESDIIEDRGSGAPGVYQDYVVLIDNGAMPLGAKSVDSIFIELEFRNRFGCYNRDTANISVTKVPHISHQAFPDLCWDEGIIELKGLSNVIPTDGIWKAIDSTGYAQASGLNTALNGGTTSGDTLNTLATPQPAEGSSDTYIMRYYHEASGCATYRDTTLIIRGLPVPTIDLKALSTSFDSTSPFDYCISEAAKILSAKYAGGVWSASNPDVLSSDRFIPAKATVIGSLITIYYEYADIYGCEGSDSVEVIINEVEKLDVRSDSSFTWYSDNMQVWVEARPTFGRTVKWEALDGGSFGNYTAETTLYTFTTNKKISSNVRVKATLNAGYGSCPAPENIINFFVHRTPCIDFSMDLDLSAKTLKLTPEIDSLVTYKWTVKDSNSFKINPVFDVSDYTDSLVNVRLQTHNKGGDDCYTDNRINLKNGSIRTIDINDLVMYPNPVTEGFYLKISDVAYNGHVELFGMNGQLVKQLNTDDGYVSCNTLAPGTYTYSLVHEGSRYNGKFVKE